MKRIVLALATAGMLATIATPGLAAGNCAEQMKRFSAMWNSTTPGHKTPEATRHYAAAQAANKANNDKQCVAELNKATNAMK